MKKKVISMLLAVSMISTSPIYAAEFSDGNSVVVNDADTVNGTDADSADSAEIPDTALFSSDAVDGAGVVNDSVDAGGDAAENAFSDQEVPDVDDGMVDVLQATSTGTIRDDTIGSNQTYNITVEGALIRSEAAEFVRLVNEAREERGLNPVTLDQNIQNISEQRAIHASVQYNHNSPDGNNSLKKGCGEVLAEGFGNVNGFFNSWKKSSAHWSILMNSGIKSIGYASFKTKSGETYAVSNVSTKQADAPIVNPLYNEDVNFSFNVEKSYIESNYISNVYNLMENYSLHIAPSIKNAYTDSFSVKCNFTSKDGIWETSDPQVATVDSNGNITAISPGTAIIHYYINGIRDYSFDTTVNVTSLKTPIIQARSSRNSPSVDLKWNLEKNTLNNKNNMGYQIWVCDISAGEYSLYNEVGIDPEDFEKEYFAGVFTGYGKTKKIKIRLVEKQSNGEKSYGSFSNEVLVSTSPSYVELNSVTIKKNKAYLSWSGSENADGYVVYRKIGKNGTYKRIKTINSGDTTKCSNSKLKKGKKYYYKVKAFCLNPDGKKIYTSWSNVKSRTCK